MDQGFEMAKTLVRNKSLDYGSCTALAPAETGTNLMHSSL